MQPKFRFIILIDTIQNNLPMPHKEQHNTQESTFDFDAMFRSYYAPMVLYAMRTTKDAQEAEDMVQVMRLLS